MENPNSERSPSEPDNASTPKQTSVPDSEAIAAMQRQLELKRVQTPELKRSEPSPEVKRNMYLDESVIEARRQAEHDRQLQLAEMRRQSEWNNFVNRRGKRYAGARLGNFEQGNEKQKVAVELLMDYCENITDRIAEGVGILLLGPPGTGKDHLLTAVCRAAILAGRTVRWENGQDLWGTIRDAISEEKNEAAMIRSYANVDVLALSDPLPPMGAMTPHQVNMLFRIIDGRYSNLRPTLLTLNVATRQEAEERMGVQIVDRIAHGALTVVCNWPSYRKAK